MGNWGFIAFPFGLTHVREHTCPRRKYAYFQRDSSHLTSKNATFKCLACTNLKVHGYPIPKIWPILDMISSNLCQELWIFLELKTTSPYEIPSVRVLGCDTLQRTTPDAKTAFMSYLLVQASEDRRIASPVSGSWTHSIFRCALHWCGSSSLLRWQPFLQHKKRCEKIDPWNVTYCASFNFCCRKASAKNPNLWSVFSMKVAFINFIYNCDMADFNQRKYIDDSSMYFMQDEAPV